MPVPAKVQHGPARPVLVVVPLPLAGRTLLVCFAARPPEEEITALKHVA